MAWAVNTMATFGATELVLLIGTALLVVGLAPYVTWRRGGSARRIAVTGLLALAPYFGWIAAMGVALTTTKQAASIAVGGSPAAPLVAEADMTTPTAVPTAEASEGDSASFPERVERALIVLTIGLTVVAGGILGYRRGLPELQDIGSTTTRFLSGYRWGRSADGAVSLGAVELTLILALLQFALLIPYITWRRGGSFARVGTAFLVSVVPYAFIIGALAADTSFERVVSGLLLSLLPIGFVIGAVVALTTAQRS